MDEFTAVRIALPSRVYRGQEMIYRRIRKMGFPMLPIPKKVVLANPEEGSSIVSRLKTEKDQRITRIHNEFSEEASEHNYSSPSLSCKKNTKGEWSVCKERPPRLLIGMKQRVFLPKIHSQKTTIQNEEKQNSSIGCTNRKFTILMNDEPVTFYPHRLTKIANC